MSSLETFPERLRRLRSSLGLSMEAVGRQVGCTGTAIWNYESGIREPTGRILLDLADALGVSPRYLLDGRSA